MRDVSARAAEDAANDGRTLNYVSHLQPKLQVVAYAATSHAKKKSNALLLKNVFIREGARCFGKGSRRCRQWPADIELRLTFATEVASCRFRNNLSRKKKSNTSSCCSFFGARCETWTHTVSHTPLKRARLPIPPISHCLYIIVDCLPFVKCFSQIYRQKSSFFSSSVTRFDLPISFVKRDVTPLCKRKNAILTFVSLRLYKWWRRKAPKKWKN